jgi:hypothetical protein
MNTPAIGPQDGAYTHRETAVEEVEEVEKVEKVEKVEEVEKWKKWQSGTRQVVKWERTSLQVG